MSDPVNELFENFKAGNYAGLKAEDSIKEVLELSKKLKALNARFLENHEPLRKYLSGNENSSEEIDEAYTLALILVNEHFKIVREKVEIYERVQEMRAFVQTQIDAGKPTL